MVELRLVRALSSVALTLSFACAVAGCEEAAPETTDTGSTTTTTVTLTGCDLYENWTCNSAGVDCTAVCDKHQITCDGTKCARAGSDLTDTSQGTGQICMPFVPAGLMDCGDCKAAFEAGCK
ncbi:MAG: hypothetical protein U0441_13050 [Polyangiaceae bacterium]